MNLALYFILFAYKIIIFVCMCVIITTFCCTSSTPQGIVFASIWHECTSITMLWLLFYVAKNNANTGDSVVSCFLVYMKIKLGKEHLSFVLINHVPRREICQIFCSSFKHYTYVIKIVHLLLTISPNLTLIWISQLTFYD